MSGNAKAEQLDRSFTRVIFGFVVAGIIFGAAVTVVYPQGCQIFLDTIYQNG
jgi:hypothetical protein